MITRMVERRFATFAGPFLPLSVWEKDGWNVEDIQNKAPWRMHPVAGKVYQVKTLTTGDEKMHDVVREEYHKLLEKYKPPGADAVRPKLAAGSTEQDEASDGAGGVNSDEDNGSDAGDDSDSSDSSSSSSSAPKAKKRKKKKKASSKKNKRQEKKRKKQEAKMKKRAQDKEKAQQQAVTT